MQEEKRNERARSGQSRDLKFTFYIPREGFSTFPRCLPLLILWLVYLVVAVVHIYVYPA